MVKIFSVSSCGNGVYASKLLNLYTLNEWISLQVNYTSVFQKSWPINCNMCKSYPHLVPNLHPILHLAGIYGDLPFFFLVKTTFKIVLIHQSVFYINKLWQIDYIQVSCFFPALSRIGQCLLMPDVQMQIKNFSQCSRYLRQPEWLVLDILNIWTSDWVFHLGVQMQNGHENSEVHR